MTGPRSPIPAPLVFASISLATGAPLSLDVPPGETLALLGDEASGVGRLGGYALGLERPAEGRALVFGTAIADLPDAERLAYRRRLGYLPAGDGLLHNLSLRDNVALPLRFGSPASPREIDGRVNVMLVAVRIAGVADRRPAQANEEERRRAALARAIAFDPTLLILEQPFDGLMARAAAELLEVARGGETSDGARRTLFLTSQELPTVVHRRIEHVYRVTRAGVVEPELV